MRENHLWRFCDGDTERYRMYPVVATYFGRIGLRGAYHLKDGRGGCSSGTREPVRTLSRTGPAAAGKLRGASQ